MVATAHGAGAVCAEGCLLRLGSSGGLAQEVEEADDLAVAFVEGIRVAGGVHIEEGCEGGLVG